MDEFDIALDFEQLPANRQVTSAVISQLHQSAPLDSLAAEAVDALVNQRHPASSHAFLHDLPELGPNAAWDRPQRSRIGHSEMPLHLDEASTIQSGFPSAMALSLALSYTPTSSRDHRRLAADVAHYASQNSSFAPTLEWLSNLTQMSPDAFTAPLVRPIMDTAPNKLTSAEHALLHDLMHNINVDVPFTDLELWGDVPRHTQPLPSAGVAGAAPTHRDRDSAARAEMQLSSGETRKVVTTRRAQATAAKDEWYFRSTFGFQPEVNALSLQWFGAEIEPLQNAYISALLDDQQSQQAQSSTKLQPIAVYQLFTLNPNPYPLRPLLQEAATTNHDRTFESNLCPTLTLSGEKPPMTAVSWLSIAPTEQTDAPFHPGLSQYFPVNTVVLPWPIKSKFRMRFGNCFNCGQNHLLRDCHLASSEFRVQRNLTQQHAMSAYTAMPGGRVLNTRRSQGSGGASYGFSQSGQGATLNNYDGHHSSASGGGSPANHDGGHSYYNAPGSQQPGAFKVQQSYSGYGHGSGGNSAAGYNPPPPPGVSASAHGGGNSAAGYNPPPPPGTGDYGYNAGHRGGGYPGHGGFSGSGQYADNNHRGGPPGGSYNDSRQSSSNSYGGSNSRSSYQNQSSSQHSYPSNNESYQNRSRAYDQHPQPNSYANGGGQDYYANQPGYQQQGQDYGSNSRNSSKGGGYQN